MNKKWRIILGISLVTAICLPIVSAAIQAPTAIYSFNRPSFEQLNKIDANQNAIETIKPMNRLFSEQTSSTSRFFQKSDLSWVSSDSYTSTITVPSSLRTQTNTADSGSYTTSVEAIQIALAQFPGISLIEPIRVDLKCITAPGLPLAADKKCWIVTLVGYNAEKYPDTGVREENGVKYVRACLPYGGAVIIDATTGEVLYVNILN